MNHISASTPKNFPILDNLVRKSKRIEKPIQITRATRTSLSDLDKMYAAYVKNTNSIFKYGSKGIVCVYALLTTLQQYGGYNNTAMAKKADIDSKIAGDIDRVSKNKLVPAIGDSTIIMDTQAKRVYYTLGSIPFFVNTDIDSLQAHMDVLSALFSEVRLPTYTSKDDNDRMSSVAQVPIKLVTKNFVPVNDLSKLKLPKSIAGTVTTAIIPVATDYPKEISALSEVKIELESASISGVYGDTKNIDLKNRNIQLTFNITLRFAFPLGYAYWSTYAKSPKNFSITNFFHLVSSQIISSAGKGRSAQAVKRLMPMQTSMDILQDRVVKLNFKPVPRINRNRFTILSDGTVLYIPKDGDLGKYDTTIRSAYDVETKKVTLLSKLNELHNIFLLSDWVHNVGVYTNTLGSVDTVDLIGAIPFEDRYVMRYLHTKNFEKAFNLTQETFINIAVEVAAKANISVRAISDQIDAENNVRDEDKAYTDIGYYSVTALFSKVLAIPLNSDIEFQHLFDFSMETNKELLTNFERKLVSAFQRVCLAVFKNIFEVKTTKGIYTLMSFAFPYYIFGVATQHLTKYRESHEKSKDDNKKLPTNFLETMKTTINLPNLPGMESGALPHAGAAYLSSLQKTPKLVSVDISAGGGKTGIILMDIVTLLNAGDIERPIVLAPGKLVSEWVSEINKWSQGKLNPYPLTANSVVKLNKYLGYDRQRLITEIKNAPKNTIFIASYSFLKIADPFKNKEDGNVTTGQMQYGGTLVNFFPNTQFIRQGGFDYVAADESHKLKNMTSQISKATRSVIGDMGHRRIASGTLVYNTIQDLEGQMALLSPGLLPDMQALINEYSEKDENSKVTVVDPKISDAIAEKLSPYISRLVYRRRDWAYLLPRVNYSFLRCDMTPNHQAFYNQKVDKKIADLLNNPKIKDILDSGDQNKIDKIMGQLDTSFSEMEIFMNCPATDPLFANLSTTKPQDLIPPKAALVNEIIDAHFNGGTVTDSAGVSQKYLKTPAKLIIFGYNKAVSLEIYKYLNPEYKGRAVHYFAGATDAILKFRDDTDVTILVADETSIKEGLNLQMASHIIRLQALWTPGATEQASSRILRSDIDNQYKREELYLTQIMCRNSMDIAKTARNISKMVSGLIATEGERPDWKRFVENTNIPQLDIIKMNLNLLRDKGDIANVASYFGAFRDITKWDFIESKEITENLIKALAAKKGVEPEQITLDELRKESRTPVSGTDILAGTKAIWTPLVPNAKILDRFGLGLEPLAIVKLGESESSDEDDEESEDNLEIEINVPFSIGDMVVTEFGFGFISNMRTGNVGSRNEGKVTSVSIQIPGFDRYYKGKDYVSLSLLEVFKPASDNANAKLIEKRLRKLAEKGQGILFVKDGVAGINVAEILAKSSPKDIKVLKPTVVVKPTIKPAEHPARKSQNIDPDNIDENDLIPADRTGKKPTITPPTPNNTRNTKLPSPTPPKVTTIAPPPKAPTTRRGDDEDEVVPHNKDIVAPVPPTLDAKNRNAILTVFKKDPKKLFHYQKQTDTTSVVIDLAVVNGEISMCTYPGEENFSLLTEATPGTWMKSGPFVFMKVKTRTGAQNLAAKLENSFSLLPNSAERLVKLARSMSSKARPTVEQNDKMDFTTLKNFVLINHKAPDLTDGLKFYPTVFDGYLYCVIPYAIQTKNASKVMKWNVPGCDKAQFNSIVSGYSFYRNKNAAIKALQKVAQRLHVVNYQEVLNDLQTDPVFQNFVGR